MIEILELGMFPPAMRGGVLCVGNFDGVHVGHALMLGTGREMATARGCAFVLMTFEPHPGEILRPGSVRKPLTTWEQRRELLAGFGVDVLVVVKPTVAFLAMEAEAFLQEVVRGQLGAEWIVEGANFTFGKGGAGEGGDAGGTRGGVGAGGDGGADGGAGIAGLHAGAGEQQPGSVAGGAGAGGGRGAVFGAAVYVKGGSGEGVGAGAGDWVSDGECGGAADLPGAGVYAGAVRIAGIGGAGEEKLFAGAISVGTNPTFAGERVTVEAYLLDFDGDLYGKVVEVEFWKWLREQETYGSVEALVKQLERDVAETRRVWEDRLENSDKGICT